MAVESHVLQKRKREHPPLKPLQSRRPQKIRLTGESHSQLAQSQQRDGKDEVAQERPIRRKEGECVGVDSKVDQQQEVDQVEIRKRDGPAHDSVWTLMSRLWRM